MRATSTSKWSRPSMDTRDPRGVASALPASFVGMEYLIRKLLYISRWSDLSHRDRCMSLVILVNIPLRAFFVFFYSQSSFELEEHSLIQPSAPEAASPCLWS
ncbi:hypothetical protein EVAR_41217_1 [Eumeta japonica]|uniref:Uncharacterized protein n=1 Tax=Eumeta variegata TaxID=151549 RepID=A0A4C1W325_EUMVA|nr:hypothetical protein EVAR_41217_1 [Eumeta japonica]